MDGHALELSAWGDVLLNEGVNKVPAFGIRGSDIVSHKRSPPNANQNDNLLYKNAGENARGSFYGLSYPSRCWMQDNDLPMKNWVKNTLVFVLIWSAFPGDWSCIAVLAILKMYKKRGDLNAQMKEMLLYVALYAAVSFFFVSKVYALVQFGVLLVYPVLKLYNGERGKAKWMKWFFCLYYPIHLIFIGVLRVCIYGDVSLLF